MHKKFRQSKRFRVFLLLQGVWLLTLGVSLALNLHNARKVTLLTAEAAAEATINRDLSIRNWAAELGGVYAPSSDALPPNPYLEHPLRDLETAEGLELTLMNPAYLIRSLQEKIGADYGVRSYLVSRDPLNPANQADAWEASALADFEQTQQAISKQVELDGQPYLRRIDPFFVEPSCMGCHAEQGYQLGEVRGGISTAVPMASYLAWFTQRKKQLLATHLGVWLLGFIGLIYGYFREKQAADQRAQHLHQLELAAEVFANSDEGILITDAEARIVDVNQAFERISGYSKAELLGKNPNILNSGRQGPEVYQSMWQTLQEEGCWQGEIWNRHKEGRVYAVNLTISALYDAAQPSQVRHYLALSSDITRLKENESKLQRLVHYDTLTGLPNRLLLTERLQQALQETASHRQVLAVILFDLDGFKLINEQQGHAAGDQFLLNLSRALAELVGPSHLLARVGGDEFVLVWGGLTCKGDTEPLLDQLLQTIAQGQLVGDQVYRVTASVGVSFYPSDQVDAEQLLRHAEQAMTRAKQQGKNCISFFDPQEDQQLRNLSAQVQEIRRALHQGELLLYYQPKIHAVSHRILGAEALIRWQHPTRGLLAPGQFLPMINEHPVMVEVGRWVIHTAFAQLDTWRLQGIDCPLSINLHSGQIQQPGFLQELQELLASYPDLSPSYLEIEVLETTAVEDLLQVSKALAGIQALGIQIAIDDFGTGYSSLAYLKHLPVNTLKIDQSFVRDLLEDPDDLAIVQGVISMAAAFKLQVIAEGVETRKQSAKLIELGCEQVQGYAISKPLPEKDFLHWLEGWSKEPRWLS